MYLFVDTETTGLCRFGHWPHMVQIAWLIYDEDGEEVAFQSHIIKPNGFKIPKAAEAIHGISTERALKEGIPLREALRKFSHISERQKIIIGHNLCFDLGVIRAECRRLNIPSNLPGSEVCTMKAKPIVNYCKLPKENGKGYKWPKLCELHKHLFGHVFEEAHDALVDAEACARCFFRLKELGVMAP
ncbi:MAG: 3'-5' exonuclease [Candidatus Aenigmarchaeota archaeon]|nr:3'-5' exonuclease [Candidatus Aenigmarchaeota archaeon]